MSKKKVDNSGPAFPSKSIVYQSPEAGDNTIFDHSEGMTLRQWLAGMALIGELANPEGGARTYKEIVAGCYGAADAMLEDGKK